MYFNIPIHDSILDRVYSELAYSNLREPNQKLLDVLDQLYDAKLKRDGELNDN